MHIIPRGHASDCFVGETQDHIYPAIEKSESAIESEYARKGLEPMNIEDKQRTERSDEEMEREALYLRTLF